MSTVKQLLSKKGNSVWTLKTQTMVFDALRFMADKNIGAVPIMDGDTMIGIFSERDYARKIVLLGKRSINTMVDELMTTKVKSMTPDRTLEACMRAMAEYQFRHMPILEDGKLVGMVTMRDVVREIIAVRESTINDLEAYISGGYMDARQAQGDTYFEELNDDK